MRDTDIPVRGGTYLRKATGYGGVEQYTVLTERGGVERYLGLLIVSAGQLTHSSGVAVDEYDNYRAALPDVDFSLRWDAASTGTCALSLPAVAGALGAAVLGVPGPAWASASASSGGDVSVLALGLLFLAGAVVLLVIGAAAGIWALARNCRLTTGACSVEHVERDGTWRVTSLRGGEYRCRWWWGAWSAMRRISHAAALGAALLLVLGAGPAWALERLGACHQSERVDGRCPEIRPPLPTVAVGSTPDMPDSHRGPWLVWAILGSGALLTALLLRKGGPVALALLLIAGPAGALEPQEEHGEKRLPLYAAPQTPELVQIGVPRAQPGAMAAFGRVFVRLETSRALRAWVWAFWCSGFLAGGGLCYLWRTSPRRRRGAGNWLLVLCVLSRVPSAHAIKGQGGDAGVSSEQSAPAAGTAAGKWRVLDAGDLDARDLGAEGLDTRDHWLVHLECCLRGDETSCTFAGLPRGAARWPRYAGCCGALALLALGSLWLRRRSRRTGGSAVLLLLLLTGCRTEPPAHILHWTFDVLGPSPVRRITVGVELDRAAEPARAQQLWLQAVSRGAALCLPYAPIRTGAVHFLDKQILADDVPGYRVIVPPADTGHNKWSGMIACEASGD